MPEYSTQADTSLNSSVSDSDIHKLVYVCSCDYMHAIIVRYSSIDDDPLAVYRILNFQG